jgi:putative phosphoesterase
MATLAVLSDLHANLSALRAVTLDLKRRGLDRVLVLGDLVGYLTRPNQVAAWVEERGWGCLAGNYDRAVLAGGKRGLEKFLKPGIGPEPRAVFSWTEARVKSSTRNYLAGLPLEIVLQKDGVRLLAVHGSPDNIRQYVYPEHPEDELAAWLERAKARVLCLGHTHVPFVRQVGAGLVVNPGSVGKSKDNDPRASYALVELGPRPEAKIVRLDWDLEAEARHLEQADLGWRVARLREGR